LDILPKFSIPIGTIPKNIPVPQVYVIPKGDMMFRQFPEIDYGHYPAKLKNLLDKSRSSIDKMLEKAPDKYDDFIKLLQDTEEEISVFFTPLSHLNSTLNSDKSQKAYEACLPMLSQYESDISHDPRLYKTIENLETDTKDQKRAKELILRDLRLSGAKLSQKGQKRLKEINLKLSELESDFARNLLESSKKFELLTEDFANVSELPESDLRAATIQKDGKKAYRFTLQMPSYTAYMSYGSNRKLREKLYRAYTTRATENKEVIDRILLLRAEKAELLGYRNYALYSLESKDAGSDDEVVDFLNQIANAALPQAKEEIEELKDFARQLEGITIESYDTAYYFQKLKKEKFGFDDNDTKPYFEQNRVLEGMLGLIEELFDIRFLKQNIKLWHPGIKVYDIHNNGKLSGRIYFDLDARAEKRDGAWMHDWECRYIDAKGAVHLPSAFVTANFPPASKGNPSLLRHDDVVTLFHEMGHALHHLLSTQNERNISGINGVAWDVVEFPSQFLENFAYQKAVLKKFAFHYQDKKPISDELIDKIRKSKNFHAARGMLRQVEFALFDIMLHQKKYQGDEVQRLLDSIREKTSLVKPPPYNKFQHGFSHIFAGGYAAGYYSYKWAELFSADAFFACYDPETGFDKTKAIGYKNHILTKGASRPMRGLYADWLSREPSVQSLMDLYEIGEKR